MINFPDALIECAECGEKHGYRTAVSEPAMEGVTVKDTTPCCDADGVIIATENEDNETQE